MKMAESLYIHIPFCRKKCLYCDFYSVSLDLSTVSDYVNVLCAQISSLGLDFRTIYIGGGTPSILSVKLWEKLLRVLDKKRKPGCEFTVEANPESLDTSKLKLFANWGVNRISIGVQSLCDDKLKKLGRIHSAIEAIRAVLKAERKGFDNISIDFIFGVWGESLNSWKEELKEAVKLPISHISVYCLSYEENTILFQKQSKKEIVPLAEDELAQMYKYNRNYLAKAGFSQYEVSSFSKTGFQCRHNLNYWDNEPYLGLGPSAVSYLGGIRAQNCLDVRRYITLTSQAQNTVASSEELSTERKAKETAALKIRTKQGIDFKWFKNHTGVDFMKLEAKNLNSLIQPGLLRLKKLRKVTRGVCLTKKGFLFCDTVSKSFL